MPGLEMRADEQDDLGVGVVGARPVEFVPQCVAEAGARRADGGVRVMAIDAPRLQHPVGVAFVPGAADMVDHPVPRAGIERITDFCRDFVQRLLPRDTLPLARAALALALQRVQDALGIVNLVDGRWSLGAVAPAAGGMCRVAFELAHSPGLLVDVSKHPAGRLAVEAGGWHQRVATLDPLRPGIGVELEMVVPLLRVGIVAQGARRPLRLFAVEPRNDADSFGHPLDERLFRFHARLSSCGSCTTFRPCSRAAASTASAARM